MWIIRRGNYKMKNNLRDILEFLLIIAALYIILSVKKCSAQEKETHCGGIERWDIKTATDDSAIVIDTNKILDYTIEELNNLVPDVKKKSKRSLLEKTIVRVKCRIISYMIEDDADFHLLLQDSVFTMIAESPDPNCKIIQDSRFRPQMANVRKNILNFTVARKKTNFYLQSGIYEITGVIFFDKIHGQNGIAKNGIEIHPILKLKIYYDK
jgi:hypothetical protein